MFKTSRTCKIISLACNHGNLGIWIAQTCRGSSLSPFLFSLTSHFNRSRNVLPPGTMHAWKPPLGEVRSQGKGNQRKTLLSDSSWGGIEFRMHILNRDIMFKNRRGRPRKKIQVPFTGRRRDTQWSNNNPKRYGWSWYQHHRTLYWLWSGWLLGFSSGTIFPF